MTSFNLLHDHNFIFCSTTIKHHHHPHQATITKKDETFYKHVQQHLRTELEQINWSDVWTIKKLTICTNNKSVNNILNWLKQTFTEQ